MRTICSVLCHAGTLGIINCAADLPSPPPALLSPEESPYQLSVELVPTMRFLEHVLAEPPDRPTDQLIATAPGGDIFVSTDHGYHFVRVHPAWASGPMKKKWTRCFTTRSGHHLLWEEYSATIHRFDPHWQKHSVSRTGQNTWHGHWSIGESLSSILYAEYSLASDTVSLWRSFDDGLTWQRLLSNPGKDPIAPEVRHFHTLQPDPFHPGYWYLSSGDAPELCRVWLSTDQGTSWVEVTDPDPQGTSNQSVHRYTAIHFTGDYLYWGTDDLVDGRALFVRARRGVPLEVEVLGELDNLSRALIATPHGLVFISEQKEKRDDEVIDATGFLSPDLQTVVALFRIPDTDHARNSFTAARTSKMTRDNVFFTIQDPGVIFHGHDGLLRWELKPK